MLRPTSSSSFTRFSLAVAGLATLAAIAPAQSDLTVTTTRTADRGSLPASANVAPAPRYYLDTIDNLNRITSDETRGAPGLAKNNYIAKHYPSRTATPSRSSPTCCACWPMKAACAK